LPDKDALWRKFARDLSSQERLRLEGIIFSQTVGKRKGNSSKQPLRMLKLGRCTEDFVPPLWKQEIVQG